MKKLIPILIITILLNHLNTWAQVTKIVEVQISNSGLYFDGDKVDDPGSYVDKPGYDFRFGRVITPHGDCIKTFGKYVFLTWYKGGEEVRNVMLSRYNKETGELATIEFPHRHTGFQNNPHIGESHNTIAVGICPLDSTIHLLYDMHAYSETRPADGSLANDYFRYQYTTQGAATVPDSEFTENLFFPKQLFLNEGENYKGLTYPEFFINLNDELMVKMREGGHTNGKYMFAKYTPEDGWNNWTDFNTLGAKDSGEIGFNWGLYGSIKYIAGKMRIGFATRYGITSDPYSHNNGFHYAYSNDPTGKTEWYNAQGEPFDVPLINPDFIKISEPGDVVDLTGKDQVRMTSGADWAVNEREDIHFVTRVNSTNVHTYKKGTETEFTTTTKFPGGDLYGVGSNMYLIGLENNRPVIYVTEGGTNNWNEIYKETEGKRFSHGQLIIENGLLYYYLMESGSGDSRPIHLTIYDLDIKMDESFGKIESLPTNICPDDTLVVTVSASIEDSVTSVQLNLDGDSIGTLFSSPFVFDLGTQTAGVHHLEAQATNSKGETKTDTKYFTVIESCDRPMVSFNQPQSDITLEEGYSELIVDVNASDPDGSIVSVMLYIDGKEVRVEKVNPYEWGHGGRTELLGLTVGEHTICAIATDNDGFTTEACFTLLVKEKEDTTSVVNLRANNQESVSIYPNPANDQINIKFNNNYNKEAAIRIYDFSGRLKYSSKKNTVNKISINLRSFVKGLYFVEIVTAHSIETKEFIKN